MCKLVLVIELALHFALPGVQLSLVAIVVLLLVYSTVLISHNSLRTDTHSKYSVDLTYDTFLVASDKLFCTLYPSVHSCMDILYQYLMNLP